jgi:hypothetical protein
MHRIAMNARSMAFGTSMKWQNGIYRLQSLVEYCQSRKFCGCKIGDAAGQIIRVCPDLSQEIEKGFAGALRSLVHKC